MKRGRRIGIAALLAGLMLVHPTSVNSSLLPELPDWTVIQMTESGGSFGWDVSDAGDVDGDGFGDVIVTGAYYESEEDDSQEGAAWVYAGSLDGLGVVEVWMYESNSAGANFGLTGR